MKNVFWSLLTKFFEEKVSERRKNVLFKIHLQLLFFCCCWSGRCPGPAVSWEREKQSLDKDGLTKTEINFSCFSGILKGPEKNFSMLTKAWRRKKCHLYLVLRLSENPLIVLGFETEGSRTLLEELSIWRELESNPGPLAPSRQLL